MIISPDEGAMQRAVYLSNILGVDMGMFYKRRDYSTIINGKNPIVAHEFLGDDVHGKDVIVIDELSFEAPSTKAAVEVLTKVNAKTKTLIVIANDNDNLVASARNIPGVIVVKTNNLSVYDILNSDSVVFTKESVKAVEGGLA